MVRVKICGVTNWPDARLACDLGAHALGFNFYPKSPRSISPAAAWDIIRRLPPFVVPVGVFVNWSPGAVIALSQSLRLGAAQLHGDESAAVVAAVSRHVSAIKALRVGPGFPSAKIKSFRSASAFLLDAAGTGLYGGSGKTADWQFARRIAKSHKIILAGGLTAENVAEAIREVHPYAVDVASGIESRPGKKDPRKLRAFFAAIGCLDR